MESFQSTLSWRILVFAALVFALSACPIYAELTESDIPADLSPRVRSLIEQTFSNRPRQRLVAVKSLGAMGKEAARAVPFLIRIHGDFELHSLDDGANCVRDALAAIGEPALEECIRAARNPSSSERVSAIWCLSEMHSPRAIDVLVELLNSSNSETRKIVIDRFQVVRDPRAVEPLLKYLQVGKGWFEAENDRISRLGPIVESLGFQKDPRAMPPLLAILNNPKEDAFLRGWAATSLGQIGSPSTYSMLVGFAQNEEEAKQVRAGAILGIGAYRPDPAAAKATKADGVLEPAKAREFLEGVAKNTAEPIEVRTAAAKALGELGDRDAIDALTSIAKSPGDNALPFWAAVSVVKLSDGNVDDSGIVYALRKYRGEGDGDGIQKKEEALRLIKGRRR